MKNGYQSSGLSFLIASITKHPFPFHRELTGRACPTTPTIPLPQHWLFQSVQLQHRPPWLGSQHACLQARPFRHETRQSLFDSDLHRLLITTWLTSNYVDQDLRQHSLEWESAAIRVRDRRCVPWIWVRLFMRLSWNAES